MKNKNQHTIGDEIVAQMRGTESVFTIVMTNDEEGCESAILRDRDCDDITIIQDYGDGIKVMFLDANEVKALERILL